MSSGNGSRLINVFGVDDPELSWPDADLSRERLGGKGYGLARMAADGLPVPPGFTLSTEVCAAFWSGGWSDEVTGLVDDGIAALERSTGKRLGDELSPLLVSVRSGAPESMPGMMDTVLDVGMTPDVERGLAAASGDPMFAADTHRRFLISYAEVVGGLDHDAVARILSDPGSASAAGLRSLLTAAEVNIPDDPRTQILESLKAVFRSWDSPRARTYRAKEGIDAAMGTAATVQMMAFGNLGDDSGTGVAFTRCPSTGEPGLIGDFLVRAQGEDIVSGTHETALLDDMRSRWPDLYDELDSIGHRLEKNSADMMDIEFTVERGKLWILQARVAKRSPAAAFRAAVDMAEDPDFPVDRDTAVARCRDLLGSPPEQVGVGDFGVDDSVVVATGVAASPGSASGALCVDVDEAAKRGEAGESIILVRRETSPADVHGMAFAAGLVTARGGVVSHAAVVARAWGLPAVVGAAGIEIDETGIRSDGHHVETGTIVTVDGTAGQVMLGDHGRSRTIHPSVEIIRAWAAGGRVDGPANADEVADDTKAAVLERALVLKGMATVDGLDDLVGGGVEPLLEALESDGRIELKGTMWKSTDETSRRHRDADAEFARTRGSELDSVLTRFNASNSSYKQLVTDWQLRTVDGQQVPNDHTDAVYDAELLTRLRDEIHTEVQSVIAAAAELFPGLSNYEWRLDRALERIESGDQRYMAHPLLDSYHTIWFELHEEFIRLTGRERAAEAAAGRA